MPAPCFSKCIKTIFRSKQRVSRAPFDTLRASSENEDVPGQNDNYTLMPGFVGNHVIEPPHFTKLGKECSKIAAQVSIKNHSYDQDSIGIK